MSPRRASRRALAHMHENKDQARPSRWMFLAATTLLCAALALSAGCSSAEPSDNPLSGLGPQNNSGQQERVDFGQPPAFRSGPLAPEVETAVNAVFGTGLREKKWGLTQSRALRTIGKSEDVRVAWMISDLLRITSDPGLAEVLKRTARDLMGARFRPGRGWREMTDHLIAWDVPAPPGYLAVKKNIYTLIVPEWEDLFVPGEIDWRHVSWGGVRIDDRPYDSTDIPCNCIPAADNPEVTSAAEATWLPENEIVFGVVIGGEARAYPRRIMEVREMVNDTLGGRALGIPYCTLCGSAQAYFTDELPKDIERPILRTSGLLIRSNKVMYDLRSNSIFDTFRGTAVTGPLAERGLTLKQASVVTARWKDWKAAHPNTTVLAEQYALGRNPDFRNNRDAHGPIFPIGQVDPRLPVQEDVLGVVTQEGSALAFQADSARDALAQGKTVRLGGISLVLDAGGLRAVDAEGRPLGSHEAFWFAWSQFHPNTALWTSPKSGSGS